MKPIDFAYFFRMSVQIWVEYLSNSLKWFDLNIQQRTHTFWLSHFGFSNHLQMTIIHIAYLAQHIKYVIHCTIPITKVNDVFDTLFDSIQCNDCEISSIFHSKGSSLLKLYLPLVHRQIIIVGLLKIDR